MELKEKHLTAIKLNVEGFSPAEIAEQLNLTRRAVDYWFADPDFREELYQQNRRAFLPIVGEARAKMRHVMRKGEKSADQLRAAKDVLKFGGMAPPKQSEIVIRGQSAALDAFLDVVEPAEQPSKAEDDQNIEE